MGGDYYGMPPLLQRALLPTLPPLIDCWGIFAWGEAWGPASPAPASCHPEPHRPSSRREDEGNDKVMTSALTSVDMGRRSHHKQLWAWDNFSLRAESGRSSMTSGEFLMASSICHLLLPLSYTYPCLPILNLHPSFAVPNLEGVGWSRGGCTESGAPCCIRNFWSSVMETKNSYHPQKPCGGC